MSSAGRATIAREAGVSIPTVSRVLSGRADVVAATRSRVEALLSEHGYRRRGRSGTAAAPVIDLVSHELDGARAVEVIKGVTRAAMDLARVPIDPSLIHKRGGPRAGPVHPRPAELGRLRRSRGVAVGGPRLTTIHQPVAVMAEGWPPAWWSR